MMYWLIQIKRMVEDIFIFPFILYGKWKARSMPLNKAYDVFFFFPFYHTGGAEKVHGLIAHALKNKKALVKTKALISKWCVQQDSNLRPHA